MVKGIILINAYTDNQSVHMQAARLTEEFRSLGAHTDVVPNNVFFAHIEGGKTRTTMSPDFVVLLDKDKYVPRMLENRGIRVFNRSRAVELCDDKMLTHIALADRGINMPATLAGPLCYTPGAAVTEKYLDNIIDRLGLPLIMKLSYGSMGREVFLISTREQLLSHTSLHMNKPHLYQRFIVGSRGEDMRIIVIGGEVRAAMLRRSAVDFRSNMELGAEGYRVQPDADYCRICTEAASVLGLDYCGVDVLRGDDGKPVLCEVNSNAFFTGIERVSGKNVAGMYAAHILNTIRQ